MLRFRALPAQAQLLVLDRSQAPLEICTSPTLEPAMTQKRTSPASQLARSAQTLQSATPRWRPPFACTPLLSNDLARKDADEPMICVTIALAAQSRRRPS
ncbi:hypothetical protein BJX64DRAFT_115531 [Aspergillus heterothallicus]